MLLNHSNCINSINLQGCLIWIYVLLSRKKNYTMITVLSVIEFSQRTSL